MGDDQETSARTIDGYIDVQSRGNFATTYLDNHLCEAEMETGRPTLRRSTRADSAGRIAS